MPGRPCSPAPPAPTRSPSPWSSGRIPSASSRDGNGTSCSTDTTAVWSSRRLARSARSSWPIFPVHRSTRRAAPETSRSPTTRKNRFCANTEIGEDDQECRSRLLGVKYHQRSSPCGERLPPEQVKVLDRRRRLTDLEIVFRRELEKSLDTGTRMLRSLTLVAMREQECQPRQPPPLVFSRGDELIDDDLRVVREVTELGLPEHQCLRVVATVPVLEPKDRRFRQRRVVHLEPRAIQARSARAGSTAVRLRHRRAPRDAD